MQKLVPHLWFEDQAEEAVNFYISLFQDSAVTAVSRYGEAGAEVSGRKAGSVMTMGFRLEGLEFIALNGGPEFRFTPAISFFVNCETREELDGLWKQLSEGGMALMELDQYPFSERFGWVQDRFGLSWQLNLAKRTQKITPFLMYVGEQCGKAEQAIQLYTSLFKPSSIDALERYGAGEVDKEGTVRHAVFTLQGMEFMAMDSGWEHPFSFNEAISLLVHCETQEEVDKLWGTLTDGGEEIQCGWLRDPFGVSWQIVPTLLEELMQDGDPVKSERMMKAMFQMKKLDSARLKQAYEQG